MAKKKNSSIVKKAVKTWIGFKAGKGAVKVLSGPVLVSGLGYYLYRKYKQPSINSTL